jgi:hypothetical protein
MKTGQDIGGDKVMNLLCLMSGLVCMLLHTMTNYSEVYGKAASVIYVNK